MPDFRDLFRRVACWLQSALWVAVVLFGLKYCFEANARAHAGESPHRWWVEVSRVHNGAYTVKSTFIRRDTVLLRLYRTGDSTLLAERTYTEHGSQLRWVDHELIYDTSDDSYLDGGIQLPPTRIDRLLAMLP